MRLSYSTTLLILVLSMPYLPGQARETPTAWEALLQKDPMAVDDPRIGWQERLILHALTPAQARSYYQGADADSLVLNSGQTLSEYLKSRLDPPANVYVPLPTACLVFRLEQWPADAVLDLQADDQDLTQQGGSATGCPIPKSAMALMLQLRAHPVAGVRARFKLWPADGPEPARAVLETGFTEEMKQTTAIVPICPEEDCASVALKARLTEDSSVSAEVLGYFRPIAATDKPFSRLPFAIAGTNTYDGTNALVGSTGTHNSAFGNEALSGTNSGTGNTAVGSRALENNTSAGNNSAVGYQALASNTTGGVNTAVGAWFLNKNTEGAGNTAVGQGSLEKNVLGGHNTAVGHHALQANTTEESSPGSGIWWSGELNTAVGYNALALNKKGNANTAMGTEAGYKTTSGGNSFFGRQAGYNNASGSANSYFGNLAGRGATTGSDGSWNSFFGTAAGHEISGGDDNAIFGYYAGYYTTEGFGNVFVGGSAGKSNTDGSENTIVGRYADVPATPSVSSATAIGHKAFVSQSNSLVLGSIKGVNDADTYARVGIGIPEPSTAFHVHRDDGTAEILVDEAAATTEVRTLFRLENNGAPRFAFKNTSSDIEWSFQQSGPGNFLISREGTGGPELQVYSTGMVRMGPGGANNFTLSSTGNLTIAGSLTANGSTFPDYVFEPDYDLRPLSELRTFIQKERRLPDIPSAEQVKQKGGHNMTELQLKLLEKIEELTLYILELEAELAEIRAAVSDR